LERNLVNFRYYQFSIDMKTMKNLIINKNLSLRKIKMLPKLIITSILTFVVSFNLVAEEIPKTQSHQPKHAVGLSLGWIVANGLSYRRYFGANYMQGTFAGTIDKDKDEEYVDVSLSFGRYLNTFDLSDMFFPVGLKVLGGVEIEHDNNRGDDLFFDNDKFDNDDPNEIHFGLGLGLDIGNPTRRGFVVSIDAIYTASFRNFSSFEFVRLGLLPSLSIHYNM